MRTRLYTIAAVVAAALTLSLGSNALRAEDEEDPFRYKWVDANHDCVSTCDNKKFACPCGILN